VKDRGFICGPHNIATLLLPYSKALVGEAGLNHPDTVAQLEHSVPYRLRHASSNTSYVYALMVSQSAEGRPLKSYLSTLPKIFNTIPQLPSATRWLSQLKCGLWIREAMHEVASASFVAIIKEQLGEDQWAQMAPLLTCWGHHDQYSLFLLVLFHVRTHTTGTKSSGTAAGFQYLIDHLSSPFQAAILLLMTMITPEYRQWIAFYAASSGLYSDKGKMMANGCRLAELPAFLTGMVYWAVRIVGPDNHWRHLYPETYAEIVALDNHLVTIRQLVFGNDDATRMFALREDHPRTVPKTGPNKGCTVDELPETTTVLEVCAKRMEEATSTLLSGIDDRFFNPLLKLSNSSVFLLDPRYEMPVAMSFLAGLKRLGYLGRFPEELRVRVDAMLHHALGAGGVLCAQRIPVEVKDWTPHCDDPWPGWTHRRLFDAILDTFTDDALTHGDIVARALDQDQVVNELLQLASNSVKEYAVSVGWSPSDHTKDYYERVCVHCTPIICDVIQVCFALTLTLTLILLITSCLSSVLCYYRDLTRIVS
jgi:hypothetical protein